MIIDIVDKSGNYIPSSNRIVSKLLFRISDIDLGKFIIKTTFSSTEDYSSHFDAELGNAGIRIKDNLSDAWTVINGDIITITDNRIKYIDIELSNISIPDMVGQSTKSCYSRMKLETVVASGTPVSFSSPHYAISLSNEVSIEFDCNKLVDNPIKAAYINIDQFIQGNPNVSLQVSNTVISDNNAQVAPITYNWVPINNGDITMIPPVDTERVGKHTIRIKITVSKTDINDVYRFFGILVDIVEDTLYKRGVVL